MKKMVLNDLTLEKLVSEINGYKEKMRNIYEEYGRASQDLQDRINVLGYTLNEHLKETKDQIGNTPQRLLNLETKYVTGEVSETGQPTSSTNSDRGMGEERGTTTSTSCLATGTREYTDFAKRQVLCKLHCLRETMGSTRNTCNSPTIQRTNQRTHLSSDLSDCTSPRTSSARIADHC
ncbi:hypothetical protein E6H18_06665 [Candidatus Bathyarchaeota archaeon]|nr:MAG: hypothetical protein E6H18_06665 [Candidatus Bathyarchaeota archaeon]